MKTEKIVGLIAWIPLAIVALWMVSMMGIDMLRLFYPQFYFPHWHHIGSTASKFVNTMGYIVLFAAAVMMIAVEVILARHGYGNKKFWKHYAIWYAAYAVFLIGMTILEGSNFDKLSHPPIIPFAIALCLYPGIALLLMLAVVAAVRIIGKSRNPY